MPTHTNHRLLRGVETVIVPVARFPMPGCFHELAVPRVRHLSHVHVERVQIDHVNREFVGTSLVERITHLELPGGNQRHLRAVLASGAFRWRKTNRRE